VKVVLLLRCFLFSVIPGSLSQSDPELVFPKKRHIKIEKTIRCNLYIYIIVLKFIICRYVYFGIIVEIVLGAQVYTMRD